ncbi:c-type cytochrome [Kaarinaea lacus]
MAQNKKHLTYTILLAALVCLFNLGFALASESTSVEAPKVPFQYSLGLQKYQKMCSGCHGKWLEGTKSGPPLMHPFYKPSHHADSTFYRAALQGVKAHHWQFGDMPPVQGATRQDLDVIVPFVRWLQREKGLYK